jgi:hypothetical protein
MKKVLIPRLVGMRDKPKVSANKLYHNGQKGHQNQVILKFTKLLQLQMSVLSFMSYITKKGMVYTLIYIKEKNIL